MVGFFKMWGVSGLTTDGAKLTEPLNLLGRCLDNYDLFHELSPSNKATLIGISKQMQAMKSSFDDYFYKQNKKNHDDAVRFLVMLAAVMQGSDGMSWNWENVRHFSQGMYGSMVDNALIFESQNMPLINSLMSEIDDLIQSAF